MNMTVNSNIRNPLTHGVCLFVSPHTHTTHTHTRVSCWQADDGWFSRRCRKINHSQGTLSFLVPSFLDFSLTEHGKQPLSLLFTYVHSVSVPVWWKLAYNQRKCVKFKNCSFQTLFCSVTSYVTFLIFWEHVAHVVRRWTASFLVNFRW